MSRGAGPSDELRTATTVRSNRTEAEPLLDVQDLAARLNISVRHVRRLVAERRIPYLKLGNLLRFDPGQINDWLEGLAACRVSAAPRAQAIPSSARNSVPRFRQRDRG